LSAFSNAEGGLLVWGIKTTRDADIDRADKLDAIADPERFANRLKELAAEYLSPPNPNIEILPIVAKEPAGAGYVVVWIGPSSRRPHRSRAPDDHRYWRRSLGRTSLMEHYEVVDMLRAGTSPSLELRVEVIHIASHSNNFGTGAARLWLYNLGPVAAKNPFVVIDEINPPSWPIDHHADFRETARSDGKKGLYSASGSIIHADDGVEVLRLKYRTGCDLDPLINPVEYSNWSLWKIGYKSGGFVPAFSFEFRMNCRYGSENSTIREQALMVSGQQLVESVREALLRMG
jgi:hypothetical protein